MATQQELLAALVATGDDPVDAQRFMDKFDVMWNERVKSLPAPTDGATVEEVATSLMANQEFLEAVKGKPGEPGAPAQVGLMAAALIGFDPNGGDADRIAHLTETIRLAKAEIERYEQEQQS